MKTFPIGGVHPSDNKLSRAVAVERFALPDEVRIPLAQHIGAPAVAKVAKGDKVLAGQLIAEAASFMSANIHAPVSGTVTAVDLQPNGQGLRQMMITIKREGDEWVPEVDLTPDLVRECTLEPKEILDRIKAAGIVGMGGATFPTHVKLSVPPGKKAEFLIINGVECEPYLTSDHRTMLEKGEELMVGTTILMRALGVGQAQIGIENNKPDAIAFLRELSKHYEGVRVTPLKVRYPQGGERRLISSVTGRQINSHILPADAGVIVLNIATVIAIYEAVKMNMPLIHRVVTLTGDAMAQPANVDVLLGISHKFLCDECGGLKDNAVKIISGGPMMGMAMDSLDYPVVKTSSSILAISKDDVEKMETTSCIRCGRCVGVCPETLVPQLMAQAAVNKDYERFEKLYGMECIECGCCTYVCPAKRPLTQTFKLAKIKVRESKIAK